MRVLIFPAVCVAVSLLVGCATSEPTSTPVERKSTTDKLEVLAMHVSPQRPVAREPWKVVMEVRNLSAKRLENVGYEFLLNGDAGKKLGVGKVPRIDAYQTVEVHGLFASQLPEGSYFIKGRVWPANSDTEPARDRMNNWSQVSVTVAK